MSQLKKFSDLLVWQKAHSLTLRIYVATRTFPKEEQYAIVSQMRRAAYSVPSNIVEGFRRKTVKESVRFYNIADASLEELKYFLLLSKDLQYISDAIYAVLLHNTEEVSKMLYGWMKSQNRNNNT